MNVLEKILEEIEKEQNSYEADHAWNYSKGLEYAKEIIRSHMNHNGDTEMAGWIPCSKRLPEEHYSTFAIYKDTHLWSKSMFEKVSDPANITYELEDGTRKTGTSYTLDGKWKIEKENRIVKRKVVAWQPLPNPYKGE